MATAAKRAEHVGLVPATDPRWVLEDDVTMPESDLHDEILLMLVEVLKAWVLRTGRDATVRRNFALRWDQALPRVGVDPDVMLVEPALPGGATLRGLCTWKRRHHPPRVAVEVVSANTVDKDYGDGPLKYAASGTRELWIFDPERLGPRAHGGPVLLQVWRRDDEGRFARCYAGDGPVFSDELGAWLLVTDAGQRLRIADDRDGQHLWATAAEQERAAKESALAEVARLQAELARLQGR